MGTGGRLQSVEVKHQRFVSESGEFLPSFLQGSGVGPTVRRRSPPAPLQRLKSGSVPGAVHPISVPFRLPKGRRRAPFGGRRERSSLPYLDTIETTET